MREAEDGLVRVLGRVAERGSVNALKLVLRGFEVYTLVSSVGKGGRALEAVLPATRDRLEGALFRLGRTSTFDGLLRVTLSSSRPISSKWPMSAMTLPSSPLSKDWKEDVFELFEVVIPGGESGLGR